MTGGKSHGEADGDRDDENQVAAQIRLRCWRRAQAVRLIAAGDVQAGAVGVGIDGDGADAEFAAAARDAHGNFAAVGDQHFLDWTGIRQMLIVMNCRGSWHGLAHSIARKSKSPDQ